MLFNKQKDYFLQGFTLIELMIVLVIIVALTVLVLSGYSEGRPRLSVERTTESFIMNFYRARDKGFFSSAQDDGESFDGKYGILVNKSDENYIFFSEEGGVMNTIEEIKIEGLSKIYEITTPLGTANSVKISFFSDSSGKNVYFDDNLLLSNNYIVITFSAKDNDEIKRALQINSTGIMEVIY
jgi:prepilin-type N-terminal cleavage/methylation domain-containing protein